MMETMPGEWEVCDFHKKVLPGRQVDVPVGSKRFNTHGVEKTSSELRHLCNECADRVEIKKDMFLSPDLATYIDGSGEPIRLSGGVFV